MLKLEDLPKEKYDEIIFKAHRHKEYKKLSRQIENERGKGNFVKLLQLKQKRSIVEVKAIEECLRYEERQRVQLGELFANLPPDKVEKLVLYTNAICFYCDMIETLAIDVNEIVKLIDKNYNVDMYDGVIKAGKEAAKQIKNMSSNTHEIFHYSFAEVADEVNELVLNKVKKCKKVYDHKKKNLKL